MPGLINPDDYTFGPAEHHTGTASSVPNHLASDCSRYPDCPLRDVFRPQPAKEAEAVTTPNVDPLTMCRLAIQTGIVDEHLDSIIGMVRRRKELLAQEKVALLAEGDVILINDNVKPKILAGARVLITAFEGDKIVGRLQDYRSDKWRANSGITLTRGLVGEKWEGHR